MKKNFTLLAIVLFNVVCFAQYGTAPQKISYQAIVRNNDNELVKNSPVSVKLSILKTSITGESEYEETHAAQTNENGLLNIQIGGGNATKGIFRNGIYWGEPHFLKTEIDPLGKNNYTIISTTELLSVPVSNYSHVSGSLHGPAWDFVGAYKVGANYASIGYRIKGVCTMTYLGIDKIMLIIPTEEIETETLSYEYFYGQVIGNKIHIVNEEDEFGEEEEFIDGIKIGNEIKFKANDDFDPLDPSNFDFTLIKIE